MNDNDLRLMALDVAKLKRQMRALYVKYDIIADDEEKRNPRKKAEELTDTETTEHLGNMSKEVMVQMVKSFNQNYDEGSVKNLHGKGKQEYLVKKRQYDLMLKRLRELGVEL